MAELSDFYRAVVTRLRSQLSPAVLQTERITVMDDVEPIVAWPALALIPGAFVPNADLMGWGKGTVNFRLCALTRLSRDHQGTSYYLLTGSESPVWLVMRAAKEIVNQNLGSSITLIRMTGAVGPPRENKDKGYALCEAAFAVDFEQSFTV